MLQTSALPKSRIKSEDATAALETGSAPPFTAGGRPPLRLSFWVGDGKAGTWSPARWPPEASCHVSRVPPRVPPSPALSHEVSCSCPSPCLPSIFRALPQGQQGLTSLPGLCRERQSRFLGCGERCRSWQVTRKWVSLARGLGRWSGWTKVTRGRKRPSPRAAG